MFIKKGEQIWDRSVYGFYSDQICCSNNIEHKVIWWYYGIFCLTENNYVDAYTKPNNT